MQLIKIYIITVLLFFPAIIFAFQVTDQAGREVEMPENPQRVIGLAPSIVDLVFKLDKGNLLVGATQFSNSPEQAKKLPRVGSYVRLDIEKIVALSPDLCLGIKDGNPRHTVDKLEALGIPVYVIDPQNLDDIIDVVNRFGHILGAKDKAREITTKMRSRINAVTEKVATISHRPAVFFQIDAAPIISAGKDTFIHELITLAGGRNVAGSVVSYPRYSWEDVLVLKPEVAIIASMAGGHTPAELKAGWLKWQRIPAVKNNRVHVVNADLVDRPTPSLIDGLEVFAKIIHPDLFGDVDGK